MSNYKSCNVAGEGCEGAGYTSCFRCGLPACRACSRIVAYLRYGSKRICGDCDEEMANVNGYRCWSKEGRRLEAKPSKRKADLVAGQEVAHPRFGVGTFQFRNDSGWWVLFEHNKFSNTMTLLKSAPRPAPSAP